MNKSIYMLVLCCLLIGCGSSEVQPTDEDDINPLDDSMYDDKPKDNESQSVSYISTAIGNNVEFVN